jgi:hypothetical protein
MLSRKTNSRLGSSLVWLLVMTMVLSSAPATFASDADKTAATKTEKKTDKAATAEADKKSENKAVEKSADKNETKSDDKFNPSEVTRVIEALEERIRILEAKLAGAPETAARTAANSEAASVAVATPAKADEVADLKKEVAEMKEEVKKDQGNFSNFFRSVEVSGVLDGYYGFNNNRVDPTRVYDIRHNAFSLQLARIGFERKNSKESPLGFRVDLGVGETVDRTISISDSVRNDGTKHILQAYASYVAPIGNGLTIDFGKMYTPVGAEVVETKDNFNYSRNWLFAYGPFYHAGLRMKYAFNDKVALSGFVFNGWDNLYENNVGENAGKTVGFQLGLTPTKKFSLTETYLVGSEAPLANVPAVSARNNVRHIADTVASYLVNDKFTLLGNFVIGSDADNDGVRSKWTGFAGYFKYQFNNNFAFSPRFTVLNDHDGVRTGTPQTLKDFTLTQEVKLRSNLLTRFEYRRDFSNRPIFTNYDGIAKGNQNTFTIGLSYFFTTREQ